MKRIWKWLAAGAVALTMAFAGMTILGISPVATVYASSDTYTVSVTSGYLALRNAPAYDDRNEIGKLYTGETVEVQEYCAGGYWWVYSPKLKRSGYVNKDYLYQSGGSSTSYGYYTVSVSSGYLALRKAPSYETWNEIGELYSGDKVEVLEKSGDTYWWVYSPKYGMNGYVNRNYLIGAGSGGSSKSTSYTVSVSAGYLAMRSDPVYAKNNEIGRLYDGDTVEYLSASGDTYWYVYSPKLNKKGYVNKKYLAGASSSGGSSAPSSYICTMKVSVKTGYLALRTAPAYDAANEKGELYTGDTVYVMDKSGSQYWYVYSPKYNDYGYVNCSYLY